MITILWGRGPADGRPGEGEGYFCIREGTRSENLVLVHVRDGREIERYFEPAEALELGVTPEDLETAVGPNRMFSGRHPLPDNLLNTIKSKWEDALINGVRNDPHSFTIKGYQAIEKTVTPGSQTSSRVYVPKGWEGKRVMIVLLEPLEE